MTNKVIDQIYRRSVERDWSVLRYNTRGTGTSSGVHDHGIAEEKDLLELVEWVKKQPNVNPSKMFLVGYSFGSFITAKVAARLRLPSFLIAPAVSKYQYPVQGYDQLKILFSAENDELIPFEQTKAYFESLPEPKIHHVIPQADHYFIGSTTLLIREVFKELDRL